MRPGISTHVFLQQRLHPGMLDAVTRGTGVTAVELFAARHHFDYHDRQSVRDIAAWFRSSEVLATLHQPIFLDEEWSRHVQPTLNLIDPDKSKRIAAMDEVKRALEVAEQFPVHSITLQLGRKDDAWNTRALENSLTAIEHLQAFARPLGVRVLLENLQNDVTTPEHLLEIVKVGHFDEVGFVLDVGHAHLSEEGVAKAFEWLGTRMGQVDLHDNGGLRDEHCWPGSAPKGVGVDWEGVTASVAGLGDVVGMLEIAHEANEPADVVAEKAREFFRDRR